MTPIKTHTERHPSIDELDRAIVNLSARINAASYELLVLIRRFDERAGWLQWGFSNCAEWLHWRRTDRVPLRGGVLVQVAQNN